MQDRIRYRLTGELGAHVSPPGDGVEDGIGMDVGGVHCQAPAVCRSRAAITRGRSSDSRISALPPAFPDPSPVACGRPLPDHRFGPSAGLSPASQILPVGHLAGVADRHPSGDVLGASVDAPLGAGIAGAVKPAR
jgi:hypothetical protein